MSFFQRLAAAMVVASVLALSVGAQTPPAPAPAAAGSPAASAAGAARTNPAVRPRPVAPAPGPSFRRSVVHHFPYPYPGYYENDSTAGFRNPGGVGRYREYYPPNNQFQLYQERDPIQVAKFAQGGGAPDRAEQLAAESIGIAKYNSIQGHIDNYARPFMGYGFGVGGYGGFY